MVTQERREYRPTMVTRASVPLASLLASLAIMVAGAQARQGEQPAPDLPPGTVKASEQKQIPIPWPMQLGVRSFQVRMRIGVVDKVVLVPDAATYVDEISKWNLRARWPVLIEDGTYSSMFVRAFKPSHVVRRSSVGAMPAPLEARQELVKSALTKSWTVPGSPVVPTTPAEAYASVRFQPFAMVLASMDDPSWCAALALASGHGQALLWLDGNFGAPSDTLSPTDLARLSEAVEDAARRTTLAYESLGDSIDAVTICRSMAVKAEVPPGPRWAPPQGAGVKGGEAVAVTDALCRNADGKRWAIAGWIFGDEIRSAYWAMCSLFLDPRSIWLMNTYPPDGQWANYSTQQATSFMEQAGFATKQYSGAQLSEVAWLNLLMGGIDPDVLIMNSKGNMDFFDLWAPAMCYPEDVPVLDKPLAMQLIHSWSVTSPSARSTVGGRWLEHGAYAYVGSVFEPYLVAFVPPALLAQRISNYVPLLVAGRWGEGELDATWRITTIGDPLMVLTPPAQPLPPRLPSAPEGEQAQGTDLRAATREALIAAKTSGDPAQYAQALRGMVNTGEDEMAVQIWRLASAHSSEAARACAPLALGSLFRQRDNLGFVTAFKAIAAPTPLDRDMLWHLWTQRLPAVDDPAVLTWFAGQVREERPAVDLRRLVPEIIRVSGADAAREAVAPWIDKAQDDGARAKVREVLVGIH